MKDFPFAIMFLVALGYLIRPFVTLFHELGHAIPAILLTKEKVTVYIGSFGDPQKSLKISIGLLEIWFRYNPLYWGPGLCWPSAKEVALNKQFIWILSGPLTSFVIAVICCYITFSMDLHGAFKLVLIVFLGLSIFDLYVNLVPRSTPIKLYDGSCVYNDGYNLKRIFFFKKFLAKYNHATELYDKKKYSEAAIFLTRILEREARNEKIDGQHIEVVYRMAIMSYLAEKSYEKSKNLIDQFMTSFTMTADDYSHAGLIYSFLGLHEKATEFYDRSLEMNPYHKYSLNNKGYFLNVARRYDEAIELFNKALEVDNLFAHSYNNRGLSKIKTGKKREGLKDIKKALSIDDKNSYTYKNLGIYYKNEGELKVALGYFLKARNLDAGTEGLRQLIDETESEINE